MLKYNPLPISRAPKGGSVCANCGTPNEKGVNKCVKCGHGVGESSTKAYNEKIGLTFMVILTVFGIIAALYNWIAG